MYTIINVATNLFLRKKIKMKKKVLRTLACVLVVMTIAFVGYSNEEIKAIDDLSTSNIEVLAGEQGYAGLNNCPGHYRYCNSGQFWNRRMGH